MDYGRKMGKQGKELNASLWTRAIDGLKEKPAYLLVFSISALFFLGGGSSLVVGAVTGNNVVTITGAVVAALAFAASCYAVKIVEEPAYRTYYKSGTIKKKWSTGMTIEPKKIEAQVEELLHRLMVEGDLSLGFSYKDPTTKIVMTHIAVGDYAERDRMADIMASFITTKKSSTRLEFNKIVIPKSGNVLFSIKVAEKLRTEVAAFRGEAYPIAKDEHLELKTNYFDGRLVNGDKVIIVDDVTFRGNTIMNTLEWLKNAGVEAKAVFVLAAHGEHVENIRIVLNTSYEGTLFYPIIII